MCEAAGLVAAASAGLDVAGALDVTGEPGGLFSVVGRFVFSVFAFLAIKLITIQKVRMFKNVPVTPRAKATPVPKEKPEWQFTYSARNCSAVLGPDVSLDIPRLF